MARMRGGLLNFLIISLVLVVVGATYVFYATPIIDEADKVSRHSAIDQFKRAVMIVRAQWIKRKQNKVFIYDTQLREDGVIEQDKTAGAVVILNNNGWPQGMDNMSSKACEQLLHMANLQQVNSPTDVYVDDIYKNGMLYCAYYLKGDPWFSYSAATGEVSEL